MLLELDHHRGVPIYRQVIRQIRQQIMTNGLEEGAQLETVRELAARLKVNPMTISKAYSFLESLDTSRGIHILLLTRIERMAHRTDLSMNFFCRTACLERITATTTDLNRPIFRMYAFFHYIPPVSDRNY